MLIDTSEDIAEACNRQRISEVKRLSVSHSDPDHVRDIRIVEKIGCDFIKGTSMPIGFYALPEVSKDIDQMNRDCIKYYGDVLHCISVNETSHIKIADILIISMVSDDGIINDGTKLMDTPLKNEIFTYDGMEIIV